MFRFRDTINKRPTPKIVKCDKRPTDKIPRDKIENDSLTFGPIGHIILVASWLHQPTSIRMTLLPTIAQDYPPVLGTGAFGGF